MEIKLIVDEKNFGDEIKDMFQNLSDQDRKEILTKISKEFLKSLFSIECFAIEKSVINDIKSKASSYNGRNYESDEDIYTSWEFRDLVERKLKFSEIGTKTIYSAAMPEFIKYGKEQINDFVEKDNEIKAFISNELMPYLKENYKKIIIDTLSNMMMSSICVDNYSIKEHIRGILSR